MTLQNTISTHQPCILRANEIIKNRQQETDTLTQTQPTSVYAPDLTMENGNAEFIIENILKLCVSAIFLCAT